MRGELLLLRIVRQRNTATQLIGKPIRHTLHRTNHRSLTRWHVQFRKFGHVSHVLLVPLRIPIPVFGVVRGHRMLDSVQQSTVVPSNFDQLLFALQFEI